MRLFLGFFLFFFIACTGYEKQEAVGSIVIIGSSTAEGVGASRQGFSWIGRLKKKWPHVQFHNLAKSNYTSYHFLDSTIRTDRPAVDKSRNIGVVAVLKPDILIICLPSNDIVKGYHLSEYLRNLDRISTYAKKHNVKNVFVCTPIPRGNQSEFTPGLITCRDSILNIYRANAIDLWSAVVDENNFIRSEFLHLDSIHLNNRGHLEIANTVQHKLHSLLVEMMTASTN